MAGREAIPVHGGEAGGPDASTEFEQKLLRLVRKVIFPEFVPVLRTMMHDVMQNVHCGCTCQTPCRVPGNQNQPSITSHFQLHFKKELPEIIFTEDKVEAKGNESMQIRITDSYGREITSGPLSMIKIEILVLDDDFGDEEQASWTEEEFNKHVLHRRKGKKQLLEGDLLITLKGGIGNLGRIFFTDHSKWRTTQKFRLGARALQAGLPEGRIQEAISEAFCVNVQRGKYTMKRHTPLRDDDVWRLKNIGKNGPYHKKLVEKGIRTVNDFLEFLAMDEHKLYSILFGNTIANKKWDTIVQHALKCNSPCKPILNVDTRRQGLVNRSNRVACDKQNAMAEQNDPTHSRPGLQSAESALLATSASETNPADLYRTHVQIRNEDALENACGLSVSLPNEDSNHVEGQQQTYFPMEGCNLDALMEEWLK